MRVILGILLGLFILYPCILFLQWITEDVLGLYRPFSVTDACLGMIIILLSVIIVTGAWRPAASHRADRGERWRLNSHASTPDDDATEGPRRPRPTARRRTSVRDQVDVTSLPGESPRERPRPRSTNQPPPRYRG